MHGTISRNDKKSGPYRGSENEISVASPRQVWSAGSGIVIVVLLVSGFLGQVVSDALDPDAIARPTVSEVAIRNRWFGHKVMRNLFSPVRAPDIRGGDYGGFSALSASEAVQSVNAVEILGDPEKPADTDDDSPAAVSTYVPRVTPPPDPTNPLMATAEPSGSPLGLSDNVGAPPVPPASTRGVTPRSSSGMRKAGNEEVGKKARQGGVGGDGKSKNRTKAAVIGGDGKKSGHAIKGKSQPGNPRSARIAKSAPKGSNPAPAIVSSAKPPVPSLAEGDVPIFGDWDQPIRWTSPYATDAAINMADEPLCKGVVSIHHPHPNAR